MLLENFTDYWNNLIDSIINYRPNKPYWIEITTKKPECIYYFGPFDNYAEAIQMKSGYVKDLSEEKAVITEINIKRCLPTKLTITEEELEIKYK